MKTLSVSRHFNPGGKPLERARFVAKAAEWLRLITLTGASQLVIQALGVVSGILVIRLLPPHEYALYTLANTTLGAMAVLTDSGISSGVTAEGSKVWQDRDKLGIVVSTGLAIRKKFALYALAAGAPLLFILLRRHDAHPIMAVFIILSVVPAFFSALSGSLLEIPLRLHQDIAPLQKIQVGTAVGRLATSALVLAIFPFAGAAIVCSGAAQLWANWRLRKVSHRHAQPSPLSDESVREAIGIGVKRAFPWGIYYCISSQLTIWLISIFGTTVAVAQIGALGRLAIALNVITSVFSILYTSRFARLPQTSGALLPRFLLAQVLLFGISAVLVFGTWLSADLLLLILGPDYSGLNSELVIAIAGACVSMMAGATLGLNASRLMIVPALLAMPLLVATQAALLFIFDLSSIISVLVYSLLVQAVAYGVQLGYGLYRLSRERYVHK